MSKKIYTVTRVIVNHDTFQEPFVFARSFLDEKKAETFLKEDYLQTLKDEKENSALEIVLDELYENNATIKMGTKAESDLDYDEVECSFKWRIHENVVEE